MSFLPEPELSLILSSLYVKNEDDPFVVVGGSKRGRGQRVYVQPLNRTILAHTFGIINQLNCPY